MTDSLPINWGIAQKRPVRIRFREVIPEFIHGTTEIIETREGKLVATKGKDFVIEGVEGEVYPITKTIFYKTYHVLITPDGQVNKGYHDVEEFYKD